MANPPYMFRDDGRLEELLLHIRLGQTTSSTSSFSIPARLMSRQLPRSSWSIPKKMFSRCQQ